jgi:hypothetical protein
VLLRSRYTSPQFLHFNVFSNDVAINLLLYHRAPMVKRFFPWGLSFACLFGALYLLPRYSYILVDREFSCATSSQWWKIISDPITNIFTIFGPSISRVVSLPSINAHVLSPLLCFVVMMLVVNRPSPYAMCAAVLSGWGLFLLSLVIPWGLEHVWQTILGSLCILLLLPAKLHSRRIFTALHLLSLGALGVLFSGPLSVYSAGAALFFRRMSLSRLRNDSVLTLCPIALLCAIPLLSQALIPLPPFPSYPELAQLTEDDGVAGVSAPLLSRFYLPLSVVDRTAIKNYLFGVGVGSAFLAIASILSLKRDFLVPTLLWGCLAIDILLPEIYAHMAPLQGAVRLIPGLYLVDWDTLFFSTLLIGSLLSSASFVHKSLSLFIFSVSIIAGTHPISTLRLGDTTSYKLPRRLEELLCSPSSSLVYHEGLGVLSTSQKTVSLKEFPLTAISTIPPSDDIQRRNLSDGNPTTRWTTGGGMQQKGSSLTLTSPEALLVAGIKVSPGSFRGDFPRAFKVVEGCELTSPRELYRTEEWRGPIQWTSDRYPYYGPQSDVTINFNAPVKGRCFTIEVTRDFQGYDWSIADIALLTLEEDEKK